MDCLLVPYFACAAKMKSPFRLAALFWLWSHFCFPSATAAQYERFAEPGEFVTALAEAPDGTIWVGTEDRGVFRSSPDGKTWTRFTVRDGLGDDNAYAIRIDRERRVWVGHQRTGLSVFDGKTWRNYDSLEGPIGERIFDIACSPVNGDVWAATSAGLTRYRVREDRWVHYTRAHGLPADRAVSLGFDGRGRLVDRLRNGGHSDRVGGWSKTYLAAASRPSAG